MQHIRGLAYNVLSDRERNATVAEERTVPTFCPVQWGLTLPVSVQVYVYCFLVLVVVSGHPVLSSVAVEILCDFCFYKLDVMWCTLSERVNKKLCVEKMQHTF